MITQDCLIYVINKGFVSPMELEPGQRVYTLDGLKVAEVPIESVKSEFIYEKLNVVNSGQNNSETTKDTRYLYHSVNHGAKYVSFDMIPKITPNKSQDDSKYLPVLSHPYFNGNRNFSDIDLEYLARTLANEDAFDEKSFNEIVHNCTGEDAWVLVDMLEFWISIDPGVGWFNRAQVKARSHKMPNDQAALEICRIAVLAGFSAMKAENYVAINYESRPIPGSIPKQQKYYKKNYIGNVFCINAKNRPILGMSNNKFFYLPTSSSLISDIMG